MKKKYKASILNMDKFIAYLLLKIRPAFFASILKKYINFNRKELPTQEGIFFIDIASNFGFNLLRHDIYEPNMIRRLKTYLKPGNIFVDLGANEGYFSVIGSKLVGNHGRVIAIEPQNRLQKIIYKNLTLNQCDNVTVVQVAISNQSEQVTLYVTPDMNTGATSMALTTRYPLSKQEISAITLTRLFEEQKISICDLLKIDIEGYEYEAILGSPDIFTSHRVKIIALEIYSKILDKRGLSEKIIINFLLKCGYIENSLFFDSSKIFISPNILKK